MALTYTQIRAEQSERPPLSLEQQGLLTVRNWIASARQELREARAFDRKGINAAVAAKNRSIARLYMDLARERYDLMVRMRAPASAGGGVAP